MEAEATPDGVLDGVAEASAEGFSGRLPLEEEGLNGFQDKPDGFPPPLVWQPIRAASVRTTRNERAQRLCMMAVSFGNGQEEGRIQQSTSVSIRRVSILFREDVREKEERRHTRGLPPRIPANVHWRADYRRASKRVNGSCWRMLGEPQEREKPSRRPLSETVKMETIGEDRQFARHNRRNALSGGLWPGARRRPRQ